MREMPLDGVRVLDLGVVLAGPQAAMILGDLGAEVIRVESRRRFVPMTRGMMPRPSRELVREMPPITGGYPDRDPGERPWNRFPWFNATARNKLGVTMDLATSRGGELFKRLVVSSDVLISNMSAGTLESLGLGYEELRACNDALVYVDATSFGATGPYRGFRGLGLEMESFAGHDVLRHYPDSDVSTNTWAVSADAAGSQAIALAAMLALRQRRGDGGGQYVDVSMVENFIGLLGHVILDQTMNGRSEGSLGNRDADAVQGCYRCRGEDRWLVLTVADDAAWDGLRVVLGDPEWMRDPALADPRGRLRRHDAIDRAIEAWTVARDRDDAVEQLRSHGVLAGPVLDDEDALADPHLAERRYFLTLAQADSGVHRYPGPPFRFARARRRRQLPPVRLGEHNEYVYRELLGISEQEYRQLEQEGEIGVDYD